MDENSNKGSDEPKLTAGEKILLHLYEYIKYRDSFEVPYEITQDGIADVTGVLRSHVPRSVKKYIDKKYVEEIVSHVKGVGRRRKVYFLTADGIAYAKKVKEGITNLEWIFGKKKEEGTVKTSVLNSSLIREGYLHVAKSVKINDVIQLYNEKIAEGYEGVIISRININEIRRYTEHGAVFCLTSISGSMNISPLNTEQILSVIQKIINKNKKTIIILDGVEYITRVISKEQGIKFVDYLNDLIKSSTSVMVITNNEPTYDEEVFNMIYRYSVNISPSQHGIKQLQMYLTKNYVFSTRIPKRVNILDRDRELTEITEAITRQGSSVVMICGVAGSGKTTVATEVAHRVSSKMNVFWLNLYEWSNVVGILKDISDMFSTMHKTALKDYMQKKDMDINDALKIVERELSDTTTLIVIDNFHKSMKDGSAIVNALVEHNLQNLKFIILSREKVDLFSNRVMESLEVSFTIQYLDDFSAKDVMDIANNKIKSLDRKDIKEIYDRIGGNPEAILISVSPEDIKNPTSNLYSFVYDELYSALSREEKDMLSQLSIYRRAVDMEAFTIKSMETMEVMNRLIRKSFIKYHDGKYSPYKIIQQFFINQGGTVIWELHKKAANYLINMDNMDKEGIEELLYHASNAHDENFFVDIVIRLIERMGADTVAPLYENFEKNKPMHYLVSGWLKALQGSENEAMLEFEKSLPWNYIRTPDLLAIAIHAEWVMIKHGNKNINEHNNIGYGMGEYSSTGIIYRKLINGFQSIFYGNLRSTYADLEKCNLLIAEMSEVLTRSDYTKLRVWIELEFALIEIFSGNVKEGDTHINTLMDVSAQWENNYIYVEVRFYIYLYYIIMMDKQKSEYDLMHLSKIFDRQKMRSYDTDMGYLYMIMFEKEKIDRPMDGPFYSAVKELNRGINEIKKRNFIRAVENTEKAADIFTSLNMLWFTAVSFMRMAEAYTKSGNDSDAERAYNSAKKILGSIGAHKYFDLMKHQTDVR
ncbi:MAG: DUF835 domain-containing protein [Candidatus Thermoplasmatota archaeon]|nr:DUF835 domain-containing protein [Candidatus Thermoplasmatota archaeon]MCL5963760.1 DUF835 domain-containing protein [Candidatus Thermoplasmatota archaeon]